MNPYLPELRMHQDQIMNFERDESKHRSRANKDFIEQGLEVMFDHPIHILENYVTTNITKKIEPNDRSTDKKFHDFLKKNNQSLVPLAMFLEVMARQIFTFYKTSKLPGPGSTLESLTKELQSTDNLKVGGFMLSNGSLKLHKKTTQKADIVIELLLYAREIELIIEGKLSSDDSLRKIMHLEEKTIMSKFANLFTNPKGDKHSSKKQDEKENEILVEDDLSKLQLPTCREDLLKEIENYREKEFSVIQHMRTNKYLMEKYLNVEKCLPFEKPEYDNQMNVLDVLKERFNGIVTERVMEYLLKECNGSVDASVKLIADKRNQSERILEPKFPRLSRQILQEIADQCLYDECAMFIMASEASLNAIAADENVKNRSIEEILMDINISEREKLKITSLELFSTFLYDRMNRADKLLTMVEWKDPNMRPRKPGWWVDYENFTFDNLVSCVEGLRDGEVTNEGIENSPLMNNRCGVCDEFNHKSQIFEQECRCIYCINCVIGNIQNAIGGRVETALECMSPSCPNKSMVETMDVEVKNNAFQLKYQYLQEIGRSYPEHKATIEKFTDMFRRYMLDKVGDRFTYCAHCEFGQLQGDITVKKMNCHNCKKYTCHECKKPWFDEHEQMSCSKYFRWILESRPEIVGLQEPVKPDSIITCPKCKETYLLQRGGCLHFDCRKCGHTFCGSCYRNFFHKEKPCPSCPQPNSKSLHAHHPRNCYYYMRDMDVDWLTQLLKLHNIDYITEVQNHKSENGKCLMKKTDSSGKEYQCKKDVYLNEPICEIHLKEVLCLMMFNNNLDPADIASKDDLKSMFRWEQIEMPNHMPLEELRDYLKKQHPIAGEDDDE